MPVMNGIELIKKLREAESNKVIEISRSYKIAHTALPVESLGDYKALGFNDFMEKPLQVKKIDKLLKKLKTTWNFNF